MNYGEKQNFEDPRDNLNLENWLPERNSKAIGGRAISFVTTDSISEDSPNELGKIISLSPELDNPSQKDATEAVRKHSYIEINGDFNNTTMAEINRAENELSQTGNISDFYDEIRNAATDKGVAK